MGNGRSRDNGIVGGGKGEKGYSDVLDVVGRASPAVVGSRGGLGAGGSAERRRSDGEGTKAREDGSGKVMMIVRCRERHVST